MEGDSLFVNFEPIQIVLGDADDTEYADARRLFIFFKTIYYLRSSASSAFLSTNWIDSSYLANNYSYTSLIKYFARNSQFP